MAEWKDRLDTIGATSSCICAVHCLAMPFITAFLPMMGLGWADTWPVEWGLLSCSAILGVKSLGSGYKEHRSRQALRVMVVGLLIMLCGRITADIGYRSPGAFLLFVGGMTNAGAHVLNRRLCRACKLHCHCDTEKSTSSMEVQEL